MKIVRAVFEKNGENLEKWLKIAKNGHFQWFSGILTPEMNFLKKIDPASVSAVWKYIKNVKNGENYSIAESTPTKIRIRGNFVMIPANTIFVCLWKSYRTKVLTISNKQNKNLFIKEEIRVKHVKK